MVDHYDNHTDTVSSPARRAYHPTKSDTVALNPIPKAVRFNTAGQVTFRAMDSSEDVVMDVVAGETVDCRMEFIRATGTDHAGADMVVFS